MCQPPAELTAEDERAKQSKCMDQQLDYNGITGNQAINHACMQLPLCHITQFTTTTSTRLPVVLNSNLWGLIPGWWFWSIWIRSMTGTRDDVALLARRLSRWLSLHCMHDAYIWTPRCAALDWRTDAYIAAWNFWRLDASTNELKYHRDARGRRAACTHVSSVIITPANYKREINLYAPTISYYKSFGFLVQLINFHMKIVYLIASWQPFIYRYQRESVQLKQVYKWPYRIHTPRSYSNSTNNSCSLSKKKII